MNKLFLYLMFSFSCMIILSACTGSPRVELTDSGSQFSGGDSADTQLGNARSQDGASSRDYDQYRIVTLLPRDAIPAVDNPEFLSGGEADSEYAPDELVIGVDYNGDARAYSIPFLSSHEIVNDTVGGIKIAVTW